MNLFAWILLSYQHTKIGYFCRINILRFIFYSIILCNYLRFITKLSLMSIVFFLKGFPHKISVFSGIFIFYYCH